MWRIVINEALALRRRRQQEFQPASPTFKAQTPAYRNIKAWRAIGNGRIQLSEAKRRPMYKSAQEALWDNPTRIRRNSRVGINR